MTMGGFDWRDLVQSTNVGAPVNHKDRIIHHEQRWGAQQRVKPTMTQSFRSGEFHLKVLREGGGERRSRHRSIIYEGDVANAVEWHQIKLSMLCDVPAAFNQRRATTFDVFQSISAPAVVSSPDIKHFPRMLPQRPRNDDGRFRLTWFSPKY